MSARMPQFTVRRLEPDDAGNFIQNRREALKREPFAFAASPEDDVDLSLEFVRGQMG